jgi:hypothetical protein
MKAYLFYILISFLVLLIPLCLVGLLGTAITEKYQIEHGRMFLEMDADEQTFETTNEELKKIDELEDEVRLTQTILISLAFTSLISIIILIVKRKNTIKREHNIT